MSAAGLVQNRKAPDEDEVDQALVDVWNQAADELGAKEEILGRGDEAVDAVALGRGHTEHPGLFGHPNGLADSTGIGHLRRRERARVPSADCVHGSQKNEQQAGRRQDDDGGHDIQGQR